MRSTEISATASASFDETRPDLRRPARAARRMARRTSRSLPALVPARGAGRLARLSARASAREPETGPRPVGRRRAPRRMRLGRRCGPRTGVRSSTSPPFASRRPSRPGRSLPAAGLPWFMTMFGRDSIFTSLQALPFTPELAATTLRVLAMWQGTRVDDFRDEDPGRILHEMRYGEMTAFEERPHSPYYGCADATALFVVLLDEYERWTGDRQLVRDLELEARAALALDRRVRRSDGQRLRLVPAPQRGDRPREPVLEGLLGLDLLSRRQASRLSARHLRAAGVRVRRQAPRRASGARHLGRLRVRRAHSNGRPPTSSAASTATSGWPTASTSRSPWTRTATRSTR